MSLFVQDISIVKSSSSATGNNGFDTHVLAAIVIAALVPLILIMIQIYRNSNPEGSRPPFLVVIMLASALVSVTPIQQVWYDYHTIWKFGLPSWIAIMIGAYRIPTRATAKCQKHVGSSSSSGMDLAERTNMRPSVHGQERKKRVTLAEKIAWMK